MDFFLSKRLNYYENLTRFKLNLMILKLSFNALNLNKFKKI